MISAHTYPSQNPPPYIASPYPPPPTHAAPMQPPPVQVYPGNTTIIHGPTVVPGVVVTNAMGPDAARCVCKSCNMSIITRVDRKPTFRTHLFALILCVVGCWPCVCLPYCMDSCNNADHYCPNCNAYIGSYMS